MTGSRNGTPWVAGWMLAALLFLMAAPSVPAVEEENVVAALADRFAAAKPTVEISYGTAYRFLFLKLMQIADVTIEATEGQWASAVRPEESIPAVFIKCRIRPSGEEQGGERRRLSIRRTITTVLTLPELKTLVYCKEADEYVNPLFRTPKITHYTEVYNLESGTLDYYRKDYQTGAVTTQFVGGVDVAQQGKEIPTMLNVMSEVYKGVHPPLTEESDFRIYVNIDGTSTPFIVTSEFVDCPGTIAGGSMKSLRCDARPAPEADGRGRPAVVWAAPFTAVAEHLGSDDLRREAERSSAASMIPLVADYALAIGYVRAWLTGARLLPPGS